MTTDNNSVRKSASNTVLLLVGDNVVQRFSPLLSEDGLKTLAAARQASRFLREVGENPDHELHSDLVEGRVMSMNAELKPAGKRTVTTYSV